MKDVASIFAQAAILYRLCSIRYLHMYCCSVYSVKWLTRLLYYNSTWRRESHPESHPLPMAQVLISSHRILPSNPGPGISQVYPKLPPCPALECGMRKSEKITALSPWDIFTHWLNIDSVLCQGQGQTHWAAKSKRKKKAHKVFKRNTMDNGEVEEILQLLTLRLLVWLGGSLTVTVA